MLQNVIIIIWTESIITAYMNTFTGSKIKVISNKLLT